jgi:hypothetical protein
MRFTVTLEPGEDGMWVCECPAIPGSISQGQRSHMIPARPGAIVTLSIPDHRELDRGRARRALAAFRERSPATSAKKHCPMPRPPILPVIDWRGLFAAAKGYREWLAAAEFPDHATRMEQARGAQTLSPAHREALARVARTVNVVAIAEDWCGDVVRHVPVLMALADAQPLVQVRFIARTDRPDVFARFLTNGGEAIPKFVFLSDAFVETGNWGPMSAAARRLIARGKASGKGSDARQKVAAHYAADADRHEVATELIDLIEVASASEP